MKRAPVGSNFPKNPEDKIQTEIIIQQKKKSRDISTHRLSVSDWKRLENESGNSPGPW